MLYTHSHVSLPNLIFGAVAMKILQLEAGVLICIACAVPYVCTCTPIIVIVKLLVWQLVASSRGTVGTQ